MYALYGLKNARVRAREARTQAIIAPLDSFHAALRSESIYAIGHGATAGPTKPCGTARYKSAGQHVLAEMTQSTARRRSVAGHAFERGSGAS